MISSLPRFKHYDDLKVTEKIDISIVLVLHNHSIDLIQRSLKSLLRQEGVNQQIVLVDDCSNEKNSLMLEKLAEQDSCIVYIKNIKSPVGWIGHNYAFELGQARADGRFILFSEANILLGRNTLKYASQLMIEKKLDHLALFPRLETGSFWEALTLPLLFLLTKFRSFHLESLLPEGQQGTGTAAFNMVNADSYRERGTHAEIRDAVFDECVLSQLMRRYKGRGLVLSAYLDVRLKRNLSSIEIFNEAKRHFLVNSGRGAIGSYFLSFLLLTCVLFPISAPLLMLYGLAHNELVYMALAVSTQIVVLLPVFALLRIRCMFRFMPVVVILYPFGAAFLMLAALLTAFKYSVLGRVEYDGREYYRGDISDHS